MIKKTNACYKGETKSKEWQGKYKSTVAYKDQSQGLWTQNYENIKKSLEIQVIGGFTIKKWVSEKTALKISC